MNYHNDRVFLSYIIFCVIRVALVFVPQHGIIHPDEFFQSVEPMAGQFDTLSLIYLEKSLILTEPPHSRR